MISQVYKGYKIEVDYEPLTDTWNFRIYYSASSLPRQLC